jgi:long-subunit fatty acid transport protein
MRCNMINKKSLRRAMLFLLVIFLSLPVLNFGTVKPLYTYYSLSYGARSLGMGNAFTAVADDLTAVYRNPAGIAEMDGPQFFANYRTDKMTYAPLPETSAGTMYTQQLTSSFESTLKNLDFVSIAVPVHFWDIKWNFALSYYRYIPFGVDATWRDVTTTSYTDTGSTTDVLTATTDITGDSGLDVIAFTSSFYLTDYLSFGITLQQFFNSGDSSITYDSGVITDSKETQDYTEKIKGRNLSLGLLVKLSRDIRIGVNYQTEVKGTLEAERTFTSIDPYGNKTSATATTTSDVTLPSQLSVGFVLKPYDFMLLSFDYTLVYWEDAKVSNYFSNTEDLNYPLKDDITTFTQEDMSSYRMGIEFNMPYRTSVFYLRGGLFNEKQIFIDGESNQVKIKGFSIGVGVDISKRVKLDLAYLRQKQSWDELAVLQENTLNQTDFKNNTFCMSVSFNFARKKEK